MLFRSHFIDSLDIARKLAAADPEDDQRQSDLSESYRQRADVEWRLGIANPQAGRLAVARINFEASLTIVRLLVAKDPRNLQWQNMLAASLNTRGTLNLALADWKRPQGQELKVAQIDFKEAIDISRKLVEGDPENRSLRSDLSQSYLKLAEAEYMRDKKDDSLRAYTAALSHAKSVVEADPYNLKWKSNLMSIYEELGDLERAPG